MKKLLAEAKELVEKLRATETVSRGDVEKAMMDKLSCIRRMEQEEEELRKKLQQLNKQLEKVHEGKARILKFKVSLLNVVILL